LLAAGGLVVGEYNVFRQRAFKVLFYALLASFVGVAINRLSLSYPPAKIINLVFGGAFAFAAFYFSTDARLLGGAATAGAVLHPFSPLRGVAEATRAYGRFVGTVVLWMSFFFLVMSTAQISRNFWIGVPLVYFTIFMIILMDLVWGVSIFFSRTIVVTYTVVVLVLAIGFLISAPSWKKAVGVDPFAHIRLSPTEILVSDIDDQLTKNQEEADAEKLKGYLAKAKAGSALKADELAFVSQQRAKAEDRSLPGLFKSGSSSNGDFSAPPRWWTDEIVLGSREKKVIANVSNGDTLRTWSTNGVTLLEEGISPVSFTAEVDMTSRFVDFTGQRSIALEAGDSTTTVRYLLTKK
jgi:hypothetical protein